MNDLARTKAAMAVVKTVQVAAPVDTAFEVFTSKMTTWWPLESHHIGKARAVAAVVEAFAGGRWFERGEDGSECDWGRVLVWDPPHRLVLSWEIDAKWQHDPALRTEVEVRFTPDGAGTRVDLEHRLLENYGDEAETMRGTFDSEGGWHGLLGAFCRAAAQG